MKKPSITELLQLLDKPALKTWANQQGLQGIDINKEKYRYLTDGLSMHKQVEEFIKNGTPFISAKAEEQFKIFIADKQILGYEHDLETEWFTGRYDLRIKWNDKIYILDFKSSKKGANKKLYLENKLQLIAYGMAEPCDAFAIVTTPDFSMINFKVENREPYEQIIKSLSTIYTQKQIIETHGTIC